MPVGALPTAIGCYEGVNGFWQRVPCLCELDIDNAQPAAVEVQVTLSMSEGSTPTLAGDFDAEVDFDDPDSSWFYAWNQQAERTGTIAVTHSADVTTVRLGAPAIELDPVSIAACGFREANAHINDSIHSMTLEANLMGASNSVTAHATATCIEPPPLL